MTIEIDREKLYQLYELAIMRTCPICMNFYGMKPKEQCKEYRHAESQCLLEEIKTKLSLLGGK